MRHATLLRYFQNVNATLGVFNLQMPNAPLFWTIERPWLNNKVGESCIPEGRYIVKPFSGMKYKDVYEVTNVEGRTAILIHTANKADQLQGCIAPGLSTGYMGNVMAVMNSQAALNKIITLLDYEPFTLDVIGGSNNWGQ
jgi:hypothetical protein